MIVDNFDLFWTMVRPSEDDPPLIVYADRMSAGEISPQRFQAVSRGNGEICQRGGAVELNEFTASYPCDICRKSLRDAPLLEDQLGKRPAEAPNQ
jgi:hypothetical protein